jgi:CIC family chloride channel protein
VELSGYFRRFSLFRHLSQLLEKRNVRLSDNFYLNLLAVATGIIVGFLVYGWIWLLDVGNGFLRGESMFPQWPLVNAHPWLVLVFPPIGGLLVGLLFRHWGRHRRFRGVSAVIESVARRGGRLSLRKSGVEFLASTIGIISGLSVGAEGPIVSAGSTIGSNVSRMFRLSPARTRVLLACGAAAGISAIFNAPIAGFFFSLELILGDFSKKAVAAIVLASVSANVTMIGLMGERRIYEVESYGKVPLAEMWIFVVLGLVCGLVAVGFAQCLVWLEQRFNAWRILPQFKPMYGAILLSLIALFFPEVLGSGHDVVEALINGTSLPPTHLLSALSWTNPLIYLLLLCLFKILATSLTLGSGAAGGKFAPSLFMGATLGAAFGLLATLIPGMSSAEPGVYSLVGMATIFGSIAQAPLSVVLMVFEMSGNYTLILPMLVAGTLSQVMFYSIRRQGVFTHKLSKLGVQFGRGKDLNILEAIPVTRAMHAGVETIARDRPLREVRGIFEDSQHHGFPVVDSDGALCGMVTTSDLSSHKDFGDDASVYDICSHKLYYLKHTDNCHTAIAMLEDNHIGRIPVLDKDGKPCGIITRSDIVGAYKLALQIRREELEEEDG